MHLTDSVTTLSGVGTVLGEKLARLDIRTIFDLLYHLPFRYEDHSQKITISQIRPHTTITLVCKIDSLKNEYTKSGKIIQKAAISDSTGTFTAIWFNQSYLIRALKAGSLVTLFGKVDFWGRTLAVISPQYELGYSNLAFVPIYPETAGISSKWLRTKISTLLNNLPDDYFNSSDYHLSSWKSSLQIVHFPPNLSQVPKATDRLAFDELFLLQLVGLLHKQAWHHTKLSHQLHIDKSKLSNFITNLPFTLTSSQQQLVSQLCTDLSLATPANRLIMGDVGSGKTVVAAIAMYLAHLNNFQSILLAPTQILAQQHYDTLTKFLSPLNIPVSLVTASTKHTNLTSILVGTHALLNTKLALDQVGLVVIDEQHRFGVLQRTLATTLGKTPHVITMTATPIPRTIALTRFGDLDISILENRPDKQTIKTWVVPNEKRSAAYKWIHSQLTAYNSQLFWVCPFIDASETQTTVKAALVEFAKITKLFPDLQVGLLHGKLKIKDKQQVLADFSAGKTHILVTTPIIEVGIDIPNASIMLIESADRFGLASLHQLRGRVGRGTQASYCLLFTDTNTDRLKHLETISSGPQLAELDLKLRGVGDIYGTAQHGTSTYFKVATYDHLHLAPRAKQVAELVLPQLTSLPLLQSLVQKATIALVEPN